MQVVIVTFIIQLKKKFHLSRLCCSTLDFLYLCVITFVIQFQTFSLCASYLCHSIANPFFLFISCLCFNSKPLFLCVGHLHHSVSNLVFHTYLHYLLPNSFFFSNHVHCLILDLLSRQEVVQFKTFSFFSLCRLPSLLCFKPSFFLSITFVVKF